MKELNVDGPEAFKDVQNGIKYIHKAL